MTYVDVGDTRSRKKVSWSEMVEIFSNVELFRVGFPALAWMRLGDEIALPPETKVSWVSDDRDSGTLRLATQFVDVCLSLSFHSWAPHLGSYSKFVDDNVGDRGEMVTFIFKMDARFKGAHLHHPDMARYRRWFENLHQFLSKEFGWRGPEE